MLRDVLKNKTIVDVVKLQRSGGVVSRNAKFRQKARSYRIRVSIWEIGNFLFLFECYVDRLISSCSMCYWKYRFLLVASPCVCAWARIYISIIYIKEIMHTLLVSNSELGSKPLHCHVFTPLYQVPYPKSSILVVWTFLLLFGQIASQNRGFVTLLNWDSC